MSLIFVQPQLEDQVHEHRLGLSHTLIVIVADEIVGVLHGERCRTVQVQNVARRRPLQLVLVVVVLLAAEAERQDRLIDRHQVVSSLRHQLIDQLQTAHLEIVLTGSGRRRGLIRAIERQPLIGRDLRHR